MHQPDKGAGYRANVDALHLASFAGSKKMARSAFDLGAGSGAVGIALLRAHSAAHVTFVEIDHEASRFCAKNIADEFAAHATLIESDVILAAESHRGVADLVVCNPPYVAPGAGRPAPEARRAMARQGDLGRFVTAARLLLGRRGRACFVYPAHNLTTLLATLRAAGIEPKRLRTVHARANVPARIVLVEGQPAKAGGLVVESPIFEFTS